MGDFIRKSVNEYFSGLVEPPAPKVAVLDATTVLQMREEIRRFVQIHHSDQLRLSGRAVARIFHGISSPAFEAKVWARNPAWKRYMHVDFMLFKTICVDEVRKFHFG